MRIIILENFIKKDAYNNKRDSQIIDEFQSKRRGLFNHSLLVAFIPRYWDPLSVIDNDSDEFFPS
jgi:hypothetical protein